MALRDADLKLFFGFLKIIATFAVYEDINFSVIHENTQHICKYTV